MKAATFERKIRLELETEGWEVFHTGIPDFMCFKGKSIKFVEAKQYHDPLRPNQANAIARLRECGLEVAVIRQPKPKRFFRLLVHTTTKERVKQFRLKDETQEDAINRALDVAESKIAEEGRRSP